MSVTIVENQCSIDSGNIKGLIVVESDSLDGNIAYPELSNADTRRAAIMKAAQLGLADPRINGSVQTYPVDSAGEEITDPKVQKVAAFRADIPVTRRLV